MKYFCVNTLETNDKRNKIYLKDSTYEDENYYFTLDLIKKEVFIGDTDQIATRKDFHKISNGIDYFYTNDMSTTELWIVVFIKSLSNAINIIRGWNYSKYSVFKRAFYDHSYAQEYGVTSGSLFKLLCSDLEKYSKLGIELSERSDFWNLRKVDFSSIVKYREKDYTKPYGLLYGERTYSYSLSTLTKAEQTYKEYPELQNIYNSFSNIVLDESRLMLRLFVSRYAKELLFLVNTCRYEIKTLYRYLTDGVEWQGLEPLSFKDKYAQETFTLFYDYVKMSYDIYDNTKFDKYPKYLHTFHDIVAKNYRIKEDEIVTKKFMEVVNNKISWDGYNDKEYIIVLPKNPADLTKEGASLHHCVGSYIKRVADEENFILFCRLKSNPEQSFLTVDIKNNELNKIEGLNRRSASQKEKEFIYKFCIHNNIKAH